MSFSYSEALSIFSIFIALGALIYSIGFQRFELRTIYRKEILEWYEKVMSILVTLKDPRFVDSGNDGEHTELLSRLYTLIEVGRFYFPNTELESESEKHKPEAYKGKRHLTLNCLVIIHDIHRYRRMSEYYKESELLRRAFTSELFNLLEPKKHLDLTSRLRIAKNLKSNKLEELLGLSPSEFQEKLKL